MKLYCSAPMASLAILIAGYELDMDFELMFMNADTRLLADGAPLAAICPKACIPAIECDDGTLLTETPVILDWLASNDPQLRLTAAAGSEDRLRINEWMAFFASEQHKLFSMLFWGLGEDASEIVRQRILSRYDIPEQALADRNYLIGESLTIADIYLFIMLRGGLHLIPAFEPQVTHPNIQAHFTRLNLRDTVTRAIFRHCDT